MCLLMCGGVSVYMYVVLLCTVYYRVLFKFHIM